MSDRERVIERAVEIMRQNKTIAIVEHEEDTFMLVSSVYDSAELKAITQAKAELGEPE